MGNGKEYLGDDDADRAVHIVTEHQPFHHSLTAEQVNQGNAGQAATAPRIGTMATVLNSDLKGMQLRVSP